MATDGSEVGLGAAASGSDDDDQGDEQDWDDWEEDEGEEPTRCLLSGAVMPNAVAAFDHDREAHGFDFRQFVKQVGRQQCMCCRRASRA